MSLLLRFIQIGTQRQSLYRSQEAMAIRREYF